MVTCDQQGCGSEQFTAMVQGTGQGEGIIQLSPPSTPGLLLGLALGLTKGIGVGSQMASQAGAVVLLLHLPVTANAAVEVGPLFTLFPGHQYLLGVLRP